MINHGASTVTEEEKVERARHGIADSEIQSIITGFNDAADIEGLQENPKAANQAMTNPRKVGGKWICASC